MNSKILLAVALTLPVMGCGAGPTTPTASPAVITPAAEPTPVPVPPPTPTPTPLPAPTPAEPLARYTATVIAVHWYDQPLFGSPKFEVVRYGDHLVVDDVSIPIVLQDERSFIARTSEMSFSVVDSDWTFNGLAGSGSGTLSKQ